MTSWVYGGNASQKGSSHQKNEDALFVSDDGMVPQEGFVAVVCDGVSSVPDGKWAAETSCQSIKEFCLSIRRYTQADFERRIEELSQSIYLDPTKRGACTLSLCWIVNQEVHAFAVGDTQVALWRDGVLYFLTENRSKEGNIRYFIGMRDSVLPGLQSKSMSLWDDDIVLIMSDGVSEIISQQDFAHVWQSCYEDPQLCAEKLVFFAQMLGSTDDNTVVVVHFRSDE